MKAAAGNDANGEEVMALPRGSLGPVLFRSLSLHCESNDILEVVSARSGQLLCTAGGLVKPFSPPRSAFVGARAVRAIL